MKKIKNFSLFLAFLIFYLGCGKEKPGQVIDIVEIEKVIDKITPDIIEEEISPVSTSCKPCIEDKECGESLFCIPYGNKGSFCGKKCENDNDCESDYSCKEFKKEDNTLKACVLKEGECKCLTEFIGSKTTCFNEKDGMKCYGERVCTEDGLSECSALIPSEEKCDLIDNDCNGTKDDIKSEPCKVGEEETSCNGKTQCIDGEIVCTPQPEGEKCDGIDNDCNNKVDEEGAEGCKIYYIDADKDAFGGDLSKCLCTQDGDFTASSSGDCDDKNFNINPSMKEDCETTEDDNCSGGNNEENALNCKTFYIDKDGDKAGGEELKCFCSAEGSYSAEKSDDCDDNNKSVNPYIKESCLTEFDDNCDEKINDEGSADCKDYYIDEDQDGYGFLENKKCLCKEEGLFTSTNSLDCNDKNKYVKPDVEEDCSTPYDDNCNNNLNDGGKCTEIINLNGKWLYLKVPSLSYPPVEGEWKEINIPEPLFGYNYEKTFFKKVFTLLDYEENKRFILHFGGIKYRAVVYVNGNEVLKDYIGAYDPVDIDITDYVKKGEENEIVVGCYDWTGVFKNPLNFDDCPEKSIEGLRNCVKDNLLSPIGGHFYLYGLWDDVYIYGKPLIFIDSIIIRSSVSNKELKIVANVKNTMNIDVNANLNGEVLDKDGKKVFDLTFDEFEIKKEESYEIEKTFSLNKEVNLWSCENPYLYLLKLNLIVQDNLMHIYTEKFGFREFTTSNDKFYLNGVPLIMRATSTWPSFVKSLSEEKIENLFDNIKSANTIALRTHTQPWQERYYSVADRKGVLIVEEAALWCDAGGGYRYNDEEFWKNYENHLISMVKRDINHPSVVMWSIENELIHCGGEKYYPELENALGELGKKVKELDPTRPIIYESDLDGGGVADVIGIHYPYDFPWVQIYPQSAYWMDNEIIYHGKNFKWEKQKPLYIGEFLWAPVSKPQMLSLFFGDKPYIDPEKYRNETKAFLWSIQIPAYRYYRVSGISPWTIFEDINSLPNLDLNPSGNLLYKVQKDSYEEECFFELDFNKNLLADKNIKRKFFIVNDSTSSHSYKLLISASTGEITSNFFLKPGEMKIIEFELKTPESDKIEDFEVDIKLQNEKETTCVKKYTYKIFPDKYDIKIDAKIGVFDPLGGTKEKIESFNFSFVEVENLNAIPFDLEILIIGANALSSIEEDVFSAGEPLLFKNLFKMIKRGGVVIVLEQEKFPSFLQLNIQKTDKTAAFSRIKDHPVLENLGDNELRLWAEDNLVAKNPILKNSPLYLNPVVDTGDIDGLEYYLVGTGKFDAGLLIVSQLLLVEKFEHDGVAKYLLKNIIEYAQNYIKAIDSGKKIMARIMSKNLNKFFENKSIYIPKIEEINLPFQCIDGVIVGGDNDVWEAFTQVPQKIKILLTSGSNLYLHKIDSYYFDKIKDIANMKNFKINNAVLYPLIMDEKGYLKNSSTSSLSNHEFYNSKKGVNLPFYQILPPDTSTADKNISFNLNTKEVNKIECEEMKEIYGGVTQEEGVGLFSDNSYVGDKLIFPQKGNYYIEINAKGTPVDDIYPLMEFRVDEEVIRRFYVHSSEWRTYNFQFEITKEGEHSIKFYFVNDAYKPPEDRNLYIDYVKYLHFPPPENINNLIKDGTLVEASVDKGKMIFDFMKWDEPPATEKMQRIPLTVLSNIGFQSLYTPVLFLLPEDMEINAEVFKIGEKGEVILFSEGSVEKEINFIEKDNFKISILAGGTKAEEEYPLMELKIDEAVKDSFIVGEGASFYQGIYKIEGGKHKLSIHFVNDLFNPPEDRNLIVYKLFINKAGNNPPFGKMKIDAKYFVVDEKISYESTCLFDPEGDEITNIEWDLGDGSKKSGATISHSYKNAGNYIVIMTLEDSKKEKSYFKKIIEIKD